MLTITYNNKKFYINITLLKEYLKTTLLKLLKIFSVTLCIIGGFILLGTAGASDTNIISMSQINKQILSAVLCFIFAYIINIIYKLLK